MLTTPYKFFADKEYVSEDYVVTLRKKPRGCQTADQDKNFNRDINSARAAIDDFHKATKIVQVVSAIM